ncbi:MAG: hydroxymethylglutaryl-CoA reductase, degradative [Anaerolineales bacterium]|nr:hydroxymethylglutaryl-CoA reductase, degradative [Anaerolineales bacterium]
MTGSSRISGFHNKSIKERRQALIDGAWLDSTDTAILDRGGIEPALADRMIENVIGLYALPLGIATNFLINGREVLVPMAVEEPSVVAGVSFMARLIREGGGFSADADEPEMIGQIQILDLPDLTAAEKTLLAHREEILAEAAEADPVLVRAGGGPRDIEVRTIDSPLSGPFLVLHLIIDVRDAMGANAVNTACERVAPLIERLTGGRTRLRILSNLADRRLARARCAIPAAALAFEGWSGEAVREGILEAYAFAAADPHRAATHNKGIMNGVDAVVLATGNDWRAVEAGAHAYAARHGTYTSLSTWECDGEGRLAGYLELPMAAGIIGGATRVHPAARAALKILGVRTARELAEVIVSVGLAQNLAALRALSTEGIQHGHMRLHARQVAIAAGASGEAVDRIAGQMVAEHAVRTDRAEALVKQLRK